MHWCLYHPQHGYYTQGRERITGKGGDFFTSTDVGPLFARIVARQIVEMWEVLDRPDPFDLVEMGAGRGLFALDFLQWAGDKAPGLHRALRYTLIESGEKQAQAALARLRESELADKIRTVENFDALSPVTGCFFSNELVDAFTVSVVGRIDGRLKELYLILKDGELTEEFGPLSSTEVAAYLARYHAALAAVPIPGWLRAADNAWRRADSLDLTLDELREETIASEPTEAVRNAYDRCAERILQGRTYLDALPQQLVHGDPSSENILWGDGGPVLIDFTPYAGHHLTALPRR